MTATPITRESFPLLMTCKHLQKALDVEERVAYALMHQEGAPQIRIGRSLYVNRDLFWDWFDGLAATSRDGVEGYARV
jgi:acyl transferase domain-containing protein